jgi:hypothetical protein
MKPFAIGGDAIAALRQGGGREAEHNW